MDGPRGVNTGCRIDTWTQVERSNTRETFVCIQRISKIGKQVALFLGLFLEEKEKKEKDVFFVKSGHLDMLWGCLLSQ